MSGFFEAKRTFLERALLGTLNTVEELAEEFELDPEELSAFFRSETVKKQLLEEGLTPPLKNLDKNDLDERQLRFIRIASNPFTAKSLGQLAYEAGISLEEHNEWLLRPHYRKAYEERIKSTVRSAQGEVARKATVRAVTVGDAKSVETYHRIINKPLPASLDAVEGSGLSQAELLAVLQQALAPEELSKVLVALQAQKAIKSLTQGEKGE